MSLQRSPSGLRSLLPRAASERLHAWHPGRARRWQKYPGLERIDARGYAALTFDDGPDPDATPAVLDALDRTGVRATFFVLGTQVESHLDLAQHVIHRGHELALHGYHHERQDRIAPDRSAEDLRRGYSVLHERLGVQCRWYRPPYGKMSAAAEQACTSLGMTVVYWSTWGLDWEKINAARIAEIVCGQLDDGGIILLHDSARYARRTSAAATADAVGMIVENARERGIALMSLGDALTAAHQRVPG